VGICVAKVVVCAGGGLGGGGSGYKFNPSPRAKKTMYFPMYALSC
jgi:hypothetical protein